MSKVSKEVRVRHVASIGRALLGRGNSQCKGPKVSIITSFTVFLDFPDSSVGKESACSVGDLGSIPELGRSPWRRKCNPLQYSCLENLMDTGAWLATVHGVTVGHN